MQLGLERLFDSGTLARGMVSLGEGRVLETRADDDGLFTARVTGSHRETYSLHLRLTFTDDMRLTRIDGACSCPVGQRCKHMVAALLAWQFKVATDAAPLPGIRPLPATPPAQLPWPLAQWLDGVAQALDHPEPAADSYPPSVRDRLVYVLDLANGSLAVTVMKATIGAQGKISDRATRYDVERLRRSDTRPQFIRRADLELLRDLEAARVPVNGSVLGHRWGAPQPRFIPDDPTDLAPLLRRIAATGRARWGERTGPFLHEGPARSGQFRWHSLPGGAQELRLIDDATGTALIALPLTPPLWLDPATGAYGDLHTPHSAAALRHLARAPQIAPEHAAEVAHRLGLAAPDLPAPQAIGVETRQGRAPVPVLRLIGLRGQKQIGEAWRREKIGVVAPALRLGFDYDGRAVPAHPATALRFEEAGKVVTLLRDGAAEARALEKLGGLGALAPDRIERHSFGKEARLLDRIFVEDEWDQDRGAFTEALRPALQFQAETLPALQAAGWRIERDDSWPCALVDAPGEITAHLDPSLGTPTGSGFFDFGLSLIVEGERVDLAPLIAQLLSRLPKNLSEDEIAAPEFEALVAATPVFVALADGRHARVETDQLVGLMRVLLPSLGLIARVHPAEAGQVAQLAEALAGHGIPFHGGESLLQLGQRLNALADPQAITPPAALCAVLRPYQATGYGWLAALADTGFGGLLADDMGLGKTLEALALLARHHLERKAEAPSLLIVPTSLARAWARQAAQFTPDLKVLVLHGPDRKTRFDAIDSADLVISTYPLLHRDHEVLTARMWEIVVLDEAQAVKNPASNAAKRIRDLRGRMRLALTGTPVENSLTDLWTLFDWLVPGLLGDRKRFKAEVQGPIEKAGDALAQARLNRRIRPFLLRRTKDEVALDLPPKTEITEFVTLGAKQQALYETVRVAMDARVREAIAARGIEGAQITILDALLKMRQACCDPGLLKDGARIVESAKRERLMEMLEALMAEGRRVLVFSQFVEMLRLIETDVQARGWSYGWLSGDTIDREGAIERFQGGAAPIFLISLKAGGVGLTLTAADTVILYDPWWNPAVERQAMDRAHRIGQTQSVFVYRLVAEGTVEEAILALQARKQALADALFAGKAGDRLALDDATLTELFRPIGGAG